jgi:hypothetical protein
MTEEPNLGEAGREGERPGATGGPGKSRPLTNDEIADRISQRTAQAIRRNVPYEITIVVILIVDVVAGIVLLFTRIAEGRWELLAMGVALQAAIGWPIARLLEMRKFNVMLQILPELIRTTDTKGRKDLVSKVVEKLKVKF